MESKPKFEYILLEVAPHHLFKDIQDRLNELGQEGFEWKGVLVTVRGHQVILAKAIPG